MRGLCAVSWSSFPDDEERAPAEQRHWSMVCDIERTLDIQESRCAKSSFMLLMTKLSMAGNGFVAVTGRYWLMMRLGHEWRDIDRTHEERSS